MGNISILVPTKNIENFTQENIVKMLMEEFENMNFESSEDFNMFSVYVKKKERKLKFLKSREEVNICSFYFNQDSYFIDIDTDIQDLGEMIKDAVDRNDKYSELLQKEYDLLIKKLETLKSLNKDLTNSVQIGNQYRSSGYVGSICKFLMEQFGCYMFDEGIHPVYMPPNYEWNERKLKR